MKLALGPVLYSWPAEAISGFYRKAAEWPVDIVYLGEVVCAKRRVLDPEAWRALARELESAGKEVVLSTLALVEAGSELGALERICADGHFAVEANDAAALHLLAGRGPFVAGPHINVYNLETLKLVAECGARRWVPPVELSAAALAELQARRPAGLETEVFAFGRLPLAFSARCFTARARDVSKDDCEFACERDPDGLLLSTQEDQALFAVNGIQIQSAAFCNLAGERARLETLGVDVLRISPQWEITEEVVRVFRAVWDDSLPASAGLARLSALAPDGWCNGYWHGAPGMVRESI